MVLDADKIGGVNENFPNHFRKIYSDLDYSVEEGEEIKKIRYEVNKKTFQMKVSVMSIEL